MQTDIFLNTVDRRLDAYEKWLQEHKIAQLCHEFEETLCGYIELFQFISSMADEWRDDVFRGEIEYCPTLDSRIKSLFERWVGCDQMIQNLLTFFEGQGYDGGVQGASKYREALKEAKQIIAEWTAPSLSGSIALHTVTLNQEQGEALRRLLA
jgi:hypothetical protein